MANLLEQATTEEEAIDALHSIGDERDCPAFRPAVPVFGSKAVADLADLLEQNGELLPLSCTNGQYYAYNVTAVADVLEEAKSEISRFRTGRILDIVRYEFRQNVLIPPIFKLPQVPTLWVYVTDQFVARAKSAGLCGIRFRQVWASQS